jgi:flagellar hook assembly protein FlgD
VNEILLAGEHRLEWDGKNNSGNTCSSGIYYVQLRTAASTLTRKMFLMR